MWVEWRRGTCLKLPGERSPIHPQFHEGDDDDGSSGVPIFKPSLGTLFTQKEKHQKLVTWSSGSLLVQRKGSGSF